MSKSVITNAIAIFVTLVGYIIIDATSILLMMGLFALSGGITNWLAIHMLFEKVPFLYGSGVILNNFEEFKKGIKTLVMDEFYNEENITYFLKQTQEKSKASIHSKLDYEVIFENLSYAIRTSQLGNMLAMLGGK